MTLELHTAWDPRDPWAKTRRIELVQYAEQLGIKEISEQMPHSLIVKKLKALGIKPPNSQHAPLGANSKAAPRQAAENTAVLDADDLAEMEWKASQSKPAIESMGFNDMRAELKNAGVKLDRKWRIPEVRAQLERLRSGKDAP